MKNGEELKIIKEYIDGILNNSKLLYPQSKQVLRDVKNFIDTDTRLRNNTPKKMTPSPPSLRDWLDADEEQAELEVLALNEIDFMKREALNNLRILKDKLIQHRIIDAEEKRFEDEYGFSYGETKLELNSENWEKEVGHVIGFHID